MTDRTKNPHPVDTPEWQLFKNMKSAEAFEREAIDERDRAERRAAFGRSEVEKFRDAIFKLTGRTP